MTSIRINNGCKRIPPMHETLQRRRIKPASQPHSPTIGNAVPPTPEENELLEYIRRMPEAERKANSAMRFADDYRVYGEQLFKSAWDFGGPHCFLATRAPFDPILSELVVNSTFNAVRTIAHIADELQEMGLVNMPNRRNRKALKAYLQTVLECYTPDFYPLVTGLSLSGLSGEATMDDAIQTFYAVIESMPKDLSPFVLKGNMQAILEIMLSHTSDDVDKADVAEFIAQYDPINTKTKAIGNKLQKLLTRKAREAIQSLDPSAITFNVALLTAVCIPPATHDNTSAPQDKAA